MIAQSYISKENLIDIAIFLGNFMLGPIVNKLPPQMSLKKIAVSGLMKQKNNHPNEPYPNLNDCLNFEHNNKTILTFEQTLKTKLSHCNFSSFYNNVQTLKINDQKQKNLEKLRKLLIRSDAIGTYSIRKNKIRAYPEEHICEHDIEITKKHELLHMSSTRKIKNLALCGFERSDYITEVEIGRGLNEGFTEFLNQVYFTEYDTFYSYRRLVGLAHKIWSIVGPEEMEKAYFLNDLEAVVNGLSKYTTRDKAIELILKMDSIYAAKGKRKEKLEREARIDVANIYLKKIGQDYKEGEIGEQTYKNNILRIRLYANGIEGISLPSVEEDKKTAVVELREYLWDDIIRTIQYDYYERDANFLYDFLNGDIKFTYESLEDFQKRMVKYQEEVLTPKQEKQQELSEMFGDKSETSQQFQNLTSDQELQQMMAEAPERKVNLNITTGKQVANKK